MISHIHQLESRGESDAGWIWCETWWMRCHGAGYGWLFRLKMKERNILLQLWGWEDSIRDHSICQTWGGGEWVDGVGWWGDVQHHAQPCDGHKPGPTFSNASQAKLWPTFFKLPLLLQTASRVSSAGVLNIWFIVRSNDTEPEWKTNVWMSVRLWNQGMFSRYTTAPSLDTNTIPSSYESTSPLQQYYQHKESLFLLMLCNHYYL